MIVNQDWIDKVTAMMPEMPDVKANRYINELKIPAEVAEVLTDSRELAEYFEACLAAGAAPVRAANWVRIEVLRVLNEKQIELKDFNIKPEVLAEIVKRVEDKKFSTTQAREIFDYIANNNVNLDGAIKACGVVEGEAVTGDALLDAIRNIIKANPDVVEEIKSGKDTKGKKMKFLQGLVMKETKGQAKPQELPDIINKLLAE